MERKEVNMYREIEKIAEKARNSKLPYKVIEKRIENVIRTAEARRGLVPEEIEAAREYARKFHSKDDIEIGLG